MEMKKVLVVGCNGRMGKLVCEAITKSDDFEVLAGYDVEDLGLHPFHIFTSSAELHSTKLDFDLIIDFSAPESTMKVAHYAFFARTPIVIATTGFTAEQEFSIEMWSEIIPVFKSANMSYGVNAVNQLLKLATKLLGDDYEIAISEFHHSGKKDAPSGTAKMFFNTINEARDNTLTSSYGSTGKKQQNEVWIASQRAGAFPGEHTVTFAGQNDFIRIEHFAHTPAMFAEGALQAARYLLEQNKPGLYTMDDMFKQ